MDSIEILKDVWKYLVHPLFEINGHKFSFMSLVTAIAVFILGIKVAKIAERIVGKFFDDKGVEKVLFEVAQNHPKVLKEPAPSVFFVNFGESSLDFKLQVWIEDLWNNEKILSDLRFSIDDEFRKNHIQIPFPQRDLHLVSGFVEKAKH